MKSALFITASAVAVGGGLYAGGLLSSGEVYDLPITEVRARLTTLPLSPELLTIAGISKSADVEVTAGPNSITWKIPTSGSRAAAFTANFQADGPARTRVAVDYVNGNSASSLEDRLTSTRFLRGYAESSFAEEVDARLEGRPVDPAKARYDFALRAAADPEQMRELGRASQSVFTDVAAQMNDTSDHHLDATPQDPANAQNTQSPVEAMKAATRPSVDLSHQH